MYEVFENLCELNNVTPYRVCKETGITTATISNWKAGRYVPKQDKMKKIADYFGVTVDYLMTGEEDTGVEGTKDIAKEKRIREYDRILLDMGLTPEDLESLIDLAQKIGKKS